MSELGPSSGVDLRNRHFAPITTDLVVHHSGFDVLIPSHSRMGKFSGGKAFDASGNAGLAANKTVPFEGDDHLVDRRWG